MRCFVCERDIAPEDELPAQVVAIEDEDQRITLIKISHPHCLPSALLRRSLLPAPPEFALSWTGVLRNHIVAAVLVWEMKISLHTAENGMVDAYAERLRSAGFRSATDRLDDLLGPVLRGWSIGLEGPDLALYAPAGLSETFYEAIDALLEGWFEAAADAGRILVVYGSGFGLDRLSPARVDRVLQAGDAVCALVPYRA